MRSVEIVISWGTTVLFVRHLTPPRAFDVGEGRGDGRPCDCFLPERVLGARRAPLLEVDGAGRVGFVLPGAATGTLTLTPGGAPLSAGRGAGAACRRGARGARGDPPGATLVPPPAQGRVDVEIAGVRIQIRADAAAGERVGRSLVSRKSLALHAVSAAPHLGLLGALARWAPPLVDPSPGMSADRIALVQQYLASADEREMRGARAGGLRQRLRTRRRASTSASRAREGSMRHPSSPRRARGDGEQVGGPGPERSPIRTAQQQALRDAAEFGMIGLLNAGGGGDPSAPTAPWGLDGAASSAGGAGLPLVGYGGLAGDSAALGADPSGRSGTARAPGRTRGSGAATGAPAPPRRRSGAERGRLRAGPRSPSIRTAASPPRTGPGAVTSPRSRPPSRAASCPRRSASSSATSPPATPRRSRSPPTRRSACAPTWSAPRSARAAAPSTCARAPLAAAAAPARPHLSVHLVLDTSGSMAGAPIDSARRAAQALVDRLAPTDDFSLTTFSSDAEEVIEDGPVGPRRAAIRRAIEGLREGGGTNIGAGLSLGYAQASRPGIPEDAVRVVLLVSDGRATSGLTTASAWRGSPSTPSSAASRRARSGSATTSMASFMSSIASDGAGGYYYLRHPSRSRPRCRQSSTSASTRSRPRSRCACA